MIHFIILFSRQGKIRLQKWYEARPEKEKKKVTRELTSLVLARKPKMCNFLEWKDLKIVYKRYASLFFLFAIDKEVLIEETTAYQYQICRVILQLVNFSKI